MNLKDFAKQCRISKNAVIKAIDEGRISSFKKIKGQYVFDPDRAFQEYVDNTNRHLSRNDIFDDINNDDSDDDVFSSNGASVLDIEPKKWNVAQALQAKTIYQALKVKHDLDVQQGKFFTKEETEEEILRITNIFSKGLLSLPIKLKQKFSDIDDSIYSELRKLCDDLGKEVERKL